MNLDKVILRKEIHFPSKKATQDSVFLPNFIPKVKDVNLN